MKLIKYVSLYLAFLAVTLASCQEKEDLPDPTDEQPLALSGLLTRTGTDTEYDIYLRGIDYNSGQFYFHDTEMKTATFPDSNPTDLTLEVKRYYPIGNNKLRLFAFTGEQVESTNMMMTLKAGEDVLLANHGITKGGVSSPEGEGAVGSSDDPVELLHFRHVMTQVNVILEMEDDANGDAPVNKPKSFRFTVSKVRQEGTYPMTAKAAEEGASNNVFAKYTSSTSQNIREGINYLLPTGATISGEPLRSLYIDDYVAESSDLDNYKIGKSSGNTVSDSLRLYPGYAYNLTFKLKQLEVTGIEVELTEWKKTEVTNDEISFKPKILKMDFGDYYAEPTNEQINKVILYSDESGSEKQYVGQPSKDDNEKIEFVLLPNTIRRVELYTSRGILLKHDISATLFNGIIYKLDIVLGKNGMLKEDITGIYLVTTPSQFIKIGKEPGGNYKQMDDLEIDTLEMDESLTSFGDFTGVYDGQWYRISKATFKGGGIFQTNSGTIKNVRIASGTLDASGIGAGEYAGVICQINNGSIIGCMNEAQIIDCDKGTVGGICGKNSTSGIITGCVNTGNIEFAAVGGGICGENENTDINAITACINTGQVGTYFYTTDIIGGICGKSDFNSDPIFSHCFWLNGTAAKKIGEPEYAVGNQTTITWDNVADLSPANLKDPHAICNVLNSFIGTSQEFKFMVNGYETGSVWPVPVKR